jgi:hypothetical protein
MDNVWSRHLHCTERSTVQVYTRLAGCSTTRLKHKRAVIVTTRFESAERLFSGLLFLLDLNDFAAVIKTAI